MNALTYDPLTLAYHELRAPLGLLATAARAVADDSDDPALRDRCAMLVRTAERMLRTAEQVFGLARAGRHDEPSWFAPMDLLGRLVSDLRTAGRPIEVSGVEGTDTRALFGSPALFEALLQSVVHNAFQHHEPGTPVTIHAGCDAGALVFTVSNVIARCPSHNGLGIGSYLCRRLAEQLDATLDTDGDGHRYTCTLRLPLPFLRPLSEDVPAAPHLVDEHIAETAHIAQH